MTELVAGEAAPGFSLLDAAGTRVSLADFAPGQVILYIYPAALTPGCTVEAIDFSAAAAAFAQAGYHILGLSPDSPDKLTRFVTKNDLTVTLLSDPELTVIKAYGGWGDRVIWGKALTGVIRSTFVIDVDAEGRGVIVDAQYGVRAKGHVDRLRTALQV
ncbi:MAG: peroxiredoxin [Propionibacteriaceae bacterium]|jgi:peroxiredoxin Q/BCP|nr:peroxiredoxin [Propionibacteriaceae bacterium]